MPTEQGIDSMTLSDRAADSSFRGAILSAMVQLMDSTDAQVLLKAAMAMILVVDDARMLSPLWKALFNLSKSENNDTLFRRERLLLLLLNLLCTFGSTSPGIAEIQIGSCSDCIYIAGTLKNITSKAPTKMRWGERGRCEASSSSCTISPPTWAPLRNTSSSACRSQRY